MQFDFFNHPPKNTQEQVPSDIAQAFNLAEKTIREKSLKLEDFEDLYSEKKLEHDREKIKRKEATFEHEPNKYYADVLEAVIFEQADAGVWFGKETRAIKTSAFDDYYHGSDIILELKDTARTLSHLSLSIDVTFGVNTEKEKMAKIKENIDKGKLGQIDYFKSAQSQFRGELSLVPQVIIGVEKDTVVKIANQWVKKHENEESADEIDEHPIKRLILSEILLQLYTFRTYAQESIKNQRLVAIFDKDIKLLEEILQAQGSVDTASLRDDKVFAAIRESLSIFKTKK